MKNYFNYLLHTDIKNAAFKGTSYYVLKTLQSKALEQVNDISTRETHDFCFIAARIDFQDDTTKIMVLKNRLGPDRVVFAENSKQETIDTFMAWATTNVIVPANAAFSL